ncbi:hypothetical protein [Endomicrobium proavitum]|uniref:Autotransporter domain-containing protein n=1 Tax=Endomicrobium proavitum TaxID=1408281 RepID=A0A0G3WID7_9BACT|nr:hypothetical protein [Endomicrobium proavitum]AKL97645.1 exported protein of unknown function [Endomicrobium proavitum]
MKNFLKLLRKLATALFVSFFFIFPTSADAQTTVTDSDTFKTLWQAGGSNDIILGNNILFDGNFAPTLGAAGASSIFTANLNAKTLQFYRSSAAASGGVFSLSGAGSAATFNSGTVLFTSNTSANAGGQGGGFYVSGAAEADFINDTVIFLGNIGGYNGGGFAAASGGIVNFENSVVTFSLNYATNTSGAFYNNEGTVTFINSNVTMSSNTGESRGGAIFIDANGITSFSVSTVNFIGNNTLLDSGGALVNRAGQVYFIDSIVNFTNNTAAVNGGAIYSYENTGSSIVFQNSKVNFTGNQAVNNGGAVYLAWDGQLQFSTLSFVEAYNNYAGGNGGFLYLNNVDGVGYSYDPKTWSPVFAAANISSNTAGGHGGALYLFRSSATFVSSATLYGNTAGISGGAISLELSTLTFNNIGGEILFAGNTAAGNPNDLSMSSSVVNFWGDNNIRFEGGIVSLTSNNAIYKTGGADLYLSGINSIQGALIITSGTVFVERSTFTYANGNWIMQNSKGLRISSSIVNIQNSVTAGIIQNNGYLYGNVDGGAISIVDSVALFGGSLTFRNNAATGRGGALFIDPSSVTFTGDMLFDANTADAGGALYITGGSTLTVVNGATLTFTNNLALSTGGAVYIDGYNNINFAGIYINATGNKAQNGAGGFMYAVNAGTVTFDRVNLSSNAAHFGGTLYAAAGTTYKFAGTTTAILHSTAIADGGAIYLEDGAFADFSNTYLYAYNNRAYGNGGFLYSTGAKTIDFYNVAFISNTAYNGGTLYIDNGTLVVFHAATTTFVKSSATNSGGAIYLNGSGNFDLSQTYLNASGSWATYAGGFLYSNGVKTLNFYEGNFSSNSAGAGGAIYAVNGADLIFNNDVSFVGNTAGAAYNVYGDMVLLPGDGGAIYLSSGSLLFKGRAEFIANKAATTTYYNGGYGGAINTDGGDGGAIWASASYIDLTQSPEIVFASNTVNPSAGIGRGGAIYVQAGSTINFVGANVITYGNTMGWHSYGAFLYADDSYVFFKDGNFVAEPFAGQNNYGRLFAFVNGTIADFSSGTLSFTVRNRQYDRNSFGNIYVADASRAQFYNTNVLFSSANSDILSRGGQIYVKNGGLVSFAQSTITASWNYAQSGGGFAYLEQSTMTLANSSLTFVNNRNADSGPGGVFYLSSSTLLFENTSALFQENDAVYGGVINAQYSNVSFNNSNALFEGNRGWGGALYLQYSTFSFANGTVDFSSGSGYWKTDGNGRWSNVPYINALNSNVSFTNAQVNISSTYEQGDAAVYSSGTYFSFENSTAVFQNLYSGGNAYAFTADWGSTVTFNNSQLFFLNNTRRGNISASVIYIANASSISITNSALELANSYGDAWTGTTFLIDGNSYADIVNTNFYAHDNTMAANFGSTPLGMMGVANGSRLNFIAGTATFTNASGGQGMLGAWQGSTITFTNAQLLFQNNNSAGGTVSADQYSLVTLDLSTVTFVFNNWASGGRSVSATNFSRVLFDSMTVILSSNNNAIAFAANDSDIIFNNTQLVVSSGNGSAFMAQYRSTISFVNTTLAGMNNNHAALSNSGVMDGFSYSAFILDNVTGYFDNNSGSQSGVIYGDDATTKLHVINSTVVFSSNSSGNNGGAINTAGVYFEGSSLTFYSNYASRGGAVNIGGGYSLISSSTLLFSSNTSLNEGGAIRAENAYVDVVYSIINFTSNTSIASTGGGIWLQNSTMNFYNTHLNFYANNGRNIADASGNSSLSFVNSTVDFTSNTSYVGYGLGMISLYHQSSVLISSSVVRFISNIGMGIYNYSNYYDTAGIQIYDSTAVFYNNTTDNSGGAIFTRSGTDIRNSLIDITSNTAAQGAGMYIAGYGGTKFTDSIVNFTSNTAIANGGAIHFEIDNSSLNFVNSTATFAYNVAQGGNDTNGGGAIFTAGSGNVIAFTSSTANFVNNVATGAAGSGGTMHLRGNYGNNNFNVTNSQFSITQSSASYQGGAVYGYGWNMNFIDSLVEISSNSAARGGALYNGGNMNFYFSNSVVNFIDNLSYGWSGGNGGNVYLSVPNSVLTFSSSVVTFANNTSVIGAGGAIYAEYGTVNFTSGAAVSFYNNVSSVSAGGAIYLGASGGMLNISSDVVVNAVGNISGDKGGFLYVGGAKTIDFYETHFVSNTAQSGGTLYIDAGAKVVFNAAITKFSYGSASANGGAIALGANSNVDFSATYLEAIGNHADGNGGFLWANAASNAINFYDTSAFLQNSAQNGGTLYGANGAQFVFNSATTNLSYSSANANGGAIYLDSNANINVRNSSIKAYNNYAASSGGFLFANNVRGMNFYASEISSNAATAGAGMYLLNSSATFNSTTTFAGNVAASSGGAIALDNSTATFNSANGAMLFTGNTANGILNDIYMKNSSATFNAVNNSIRLEDGIIVETAQNAINKFGDQDLYLSGVNYIKGTVNLLEGAISVDRATFTYSNGNWNIINSNGFRVSSSVVNVANTVNTTIRNNSNADGGAMSIIDSSATFGGAMVFTSNTATGRGGALYIDPSEVIFESTVTFTSNTATLGGAVYIEGGSTVTFVAGGTVTFAWNKATSSGGAVYIDGYNNIDFSSVYVNAQSNHAQSGGGGFMYAANAGTVTFGGVTFSASSASYGGTLYGDGNTIFKFTAATTTFTGSRASVDGGSIYLNGNANVDFSQTYLNASNGYAGRDGGFLYLQGAKTVDIYASLFTLNTAGRYGGAIALADGATLNFASQNVNFSTNTANAGGALSLDNTQITFGNGSTFTFVNNVATSSGGAIFAINGSTVTLSSNAYYNVAGNNAQYGGFIYADDSYINIDGAVINSSTNNIVGMAIAAFNGSKLTVSSSSFISVGYTVSGGQGEKGAVYLNGSTADFSNVIFASNTASHGAAITAENSLINFRGSNTFIYDNRGGGAEGAIVHLTGSSVTLDNNGFINVVSNPSRFIYSTDSYIDFSSGYVTDSGHTVYGGYGSFAYLVDTNLNIGSATIYNNLAVCGGAIYFANTNTMTIANATFAGNTSYEGGVLYFAVGHNSSLYLTSVTFSGNGNSGYYLPVRGGAIYNSNGVLNFTVLSGGLVTFTGNTATSLGNDIYNAAGAILNFNGEGDIALNGGIYNIGTLNKTNSGDIYFGSGSTNTFGGTVAMSSGNVYFENGSTNVVTGAWTSSGGNTYFNGGSSNAISGTLTTTGGNAYFAAGSRNNISGRLQLNSGGAYFSTSAYVNVLEITTGTLGLDVDWLAGGRGAQTAFIETGSTTLTNASKLAVTTLTPTLQVVGSSTAIMSADWINNIAFSTNNISGGDQYGYRFVWGGTTGDYTGWLVYGALPWNTFVSQYQNAVAGSTITLAQDIYADALIGDDNPFSATSGNNFTIDVAGHVINSSGLANKIIVLSGKNINLSNATLRNFTGSAYGGAIYNLGGSTLTITNVNFSSNSNTNGSIGGGAIYNTDSVINITSSVFAGNYVVNDGGAIVNYNTVLIATDVAFISNRANSGSNGGGAIYNVASYVNLTNALFDSNQSNHGGAINNNFVNSTVTITNAVFTQNIVTLSGSSRGGGAIYNAGTLNISSAVFEENSALNADNRGGAIYNTGIINFNTASSSVIFTGNRASSAANGHDIYNSGTISITGNGDVVISSGIAGNGIINNSANIYLAGINNSYNGLFNQTAGYTKVTGSYFTGISSITGGVVELANGASITNGTIGLWNSTGTLDITTADNLTFTGNVAGNGYIYKELSSTGTLTLIGDNSAFNGNFTQLAGTTTVTAAGKIFGGTNTISNSLLNITGSDIYYTVNLSTNGILRNFSNSNLSSSTINGDIIKFIASGATATFNNLTGENYAYYTLANRLENGQANTVIFNNSYVEISSDNYAGATAYNFNNSVLDISNYASQSTRTITFGDVFVTGNSGLNFGITFNEIVANSSYGFTSDKIYTSTASTGKLDMFGIRVYNGDQYLKLGGLYSTQVLFGGLEFSNATSSVTIYMATHTFIVWSMPDLQSIYVLMEGGRSLYDANLETGNRDYIIDTLAPYHIDQPFTDTSWGRFMVEGYDADASSWVISGVINSMDAYNNTRSYLFTLSSATDFTLRNVTVTSAATSAAHSGNGSVILQTAPNSTATVRNVYLTYNAATSSGGAIATFAGNISIDSVTFIGNTANASGGAVYAQGNTINFNDVIFTSNVAVSSGGAISATQNSVLNFEGNVLFAGNTIGEGVSGGAIYLDNSTAIFKNNAEVIFAGNTLPSGVGNLVGGAAISLVNNSFVDFSGAYLNAYSNIARNYGGFAFVDNSSIIIGSATFALNQSAEGGGAIYATSASNIVFTSYVIFSSNVLTSGPYGGGAISNSGNIYFIGSTAVFNGNSITSAAGGSAIINNGNIKFSSSVVSFTNNNKYAVVNVSPGGFGTGTIDFTSSEVIFSSNNDGALRNESATGFATVNFGAVTFAYNSGLYGGAIRNGQYAYSGATINFMEVAGSTSLFIGNTSPIGNDIYNVNTLKFQGAGDVIFNGGIENANSGIIQKTGAGNIYFNAGSLNKLNGQVQTSSGNVYFANGSTSTIGNWTNAGANVYFQNGSTNTIIAWRNNSGNAYFDGGSINTINNYTSTGGATYFAAGSNDTVTGTLSLTGGIVNFATTAYVNNLNITNGTLGLNVDWSSAYGAQTSFIYSSATSLTANSKLLVTTVTPVSVVGSSTAVIFADYINGVVFSTNNILGGDQYGYRYVWSGTQGNYTGWLVYGALPWNTFVSQYQTAVAGSTITLAQDIYAVIGDSNPFAQTAGNNFTIDGGGYVINSSAMPNRAINASGNKNINITNVTFAYFNGGVINGNNTSTTNFVADGTVNFASNTAVNGGAINNGTIFFVEGSTVNFIKNTASTNGGAIYNNATINIYGNVNFTTNTAQYGGAVYEDSSGIVNFSTGAIVNFTSNSAVNGGAIYLNSNGTLAFLQGSEVNFIGNAASEKGGAISGAIIKFAEGSTVTFIGNKAQYGGAIQHYNPMSNEALVFSTGVHFVTGGNTADYGGFLSTFMSSVLFKSGVDLSFSNSSAAIAGGFLYAQGTYGNLGSITFEDGIYASSNSAALGGFIAAVEGYLPAVINIGSATIIGNVATSSGGAIYLQSSTANFNSATGAIVLASNTANGKANDIYAAGSYINFNAENNQIRIEDGIYIGAGGNNIISKTGLGELYISGNNYIQGAVNVTSGTVRIDKATWTHENGTFNETGSNGITITNSIANFAVTNFTASNNVAASSGGAIALYNSTVTFYTGIFSSNTANGVKNDIYAENSVINFVANNNITLEDGIYVGAANNVINKTGNNYSLYLGGVNYLQGTLNHTEGNIQINKATFTFENGSWNSSGKGVSIASSVVNVAASVNVNLSNNSGAYLGGALKIVDSTVTFSGTVLIATNATTMYYSNNYHGGGVYVQSSSLSFNGGVLFSSNSAQTPNNQGASGGAVYAINSQIYFNEISSFTNNAANGYQGSYGYGGAIYAANSNVEFNKNAYFANNSGYAGAAIYLTGSTAAFNNGAFIFDTNNSSMRPGGAIYAESSQVEFNSADVIFKNSAVGSGSSMQSGGGIYANNSSITFNGGAVEFLNNYANSGAGMSVYSSTINFNNTAVLFTANASTGSSMGPGGRRGGAITNNTGVVNFVSGEILFSSNTAERGGAIYNDTNGIINFSSVTFDNNAARDGSGGAINNIATINFNDTAIFTNNKVSVLYNPTTLGGGAIFNSGTINLAGNIMFVDNNVQGAQQAAGGAIYNSGSALNFVAGSTISFVGNISEYLGGAIYADNGAQVLFSSGIAQLVVAGNTAEKGGFIAVENATATFDGGNFSFSNSTASISGGFLYATNNAIANFENVYASSNSAALGGFIAAESGAVINIGSAVITGNVATSSGGAIYLQTSTANFNSATGAIVFASNTANGKANDIYAAGSYINFNAENNQIRIEDGIYVGNAQNTISKTGLGELYISGNNYMQGNFNVTAGSVTINRATWTFETGSWNVTTSSGVRITSSVVTIANSVTSAFEQNQGWATSIIDSTITFNAAVRFSTNSGAISALNAQITFNDNIVVEGHSNAMVVTGSSMSFNGALKMFVGSGVSSTGVGGGAISSSNSVVLFKNGTSNFINNNASYASGGAIYAEGSTISFTNERVTFTSNAVTTGGGGAIYSDGSLVEFITSTAIFAGNAGDYGTGGIYAYNSSVVRFINSNAEFTENKITSGSGGAMNVRGLLYVDGGKISFTSNTANNYGGAIYTLNDSSNVFVNTEVKFTSNNATEGGAIYANTRSTITFTAAPVIFDNNIAAVSGGAIYSNLANITFNNGNATFTNNKALTGSGGAIYAVDDLVFDGANVDFTGNEALAGNGGAIFADDTILTIKNAVMTFMNNKSLLGGAVYASNNSNITLSGRGSFTGNEANASGAAVYVTGGSTVTIEAANGDIIFSGNKAAGTPNDIYADNNSRLNLITSGTNTISIAGGILSNTAGTGVAVNKTGTGTLLLGGDNEVWGSFTATAGKVELLGAASYKGNSLMLNNTIFNMTDDIDFDGSYLNTVNVKTFESDTQMLMDVFENGTSDQVFADSATIGGDLTLKVETGNYNNDTYYDLIISTVNQIYGAFTSSQIVTNGLTNLQSKIYYEQFTSSEVIRLWLRGVYNSNFESIGNATFNQTEVAKAFDKLSVDNTVAVHQFISNLWNSGAYTNEEKKSILSEISPYFITNVIESAAQDSDNNELYDRIKNHSRREHTNSAIWAQVTGGNTKLGGDENSLGEYKDNRYGVMAGFDIYFGSMSSINKTMLGIYVNYKDHSITQQESKATLNKMGLGFYGGYIEESYEIKAMISGSKDSYETTRAIKLNGFAADRTASGKFDGLTLGADVEGALKYKIGNNTNFRPYAGAELKNVSYDGFTETGASELNLKVEAGNYLRTTARLGAGVNYDDKTWAGYVNLEGKYLLTGKKYEIESVFEGTDVKFLSRGYEENGLILGATLGGSVRITEGLKFFINANAHTAEKFTNLYANAGLRYNFCGITHKEPTKVYVVTYNDKNFYFRDTQAAQDFIAKMNKAGAEISTTSIKEKFVADETVVPVSYNVKEIIKVKTK